MFEELPIFISHVIFFANWASHLNPFHQNWQFDMNKGSVGSVWYIFQFFPLLSEEVKCSNLELKNTVYSHNWPVAGLSPTKPNSIYFST